MLPSELAAQLTAAFPALAASLQAPAVQTSIYRQLGCFADFTRQAGLLGRQGQLRRCFELADDLLTHGDRNVASAIATVYLHELHLDGSLRDLRLAQGLMPSRLGQAYAQQRRPSLP